MHEDLLHYLWANQNWADFSLHTTKGTPITIADPGKSNPHEGADFQGATLHMGKQKVQGAIEIDLHGAYWYAHGHHKSPHYNEVVLHVIWDKPRPAFTQKGEALPTLSLKDYIAPTFVSKFGSSCPKTHTYISPKRWQKILTQHAKKRLQKKAEKVLALFQAHQEDSEATACQWLAYALGGKVNSDPMMTLLEKTPFSLLQRYRNSVFHLEALLLGQAGLLTSSAPLAHPYEKEIQALHKKLVARHKLPPCHLLWKRSRLRPPHFPTIRIAQLVQLLHQHESIFDLLINQKLAHAPTSLAVKPSCYWQNHYTFGQKSSKKVGALGKATIQLLLINVTAPLLVAYGKLRNEAFYTTKALTLLESFPPEKNNITKKYSTLGIALSDALSSQGALELYAQWGDAHRCFQCDLEAAFPL